MRTCGILLLLCACSPGGPSGSGDTGTTDPYLANADPRVNTYLPDGYEPVAPTRVVFLGDSITAGYGTTDPSLAYTALLQENNADAWPGYDDQTIPSLFPTVTEWVDVSRGGATTDTEANEQLSQLGRKLTYPVSGPTIAITTIGGNDMTALLMAGDQRDAQMDAVQENLATIASYFQDATQFPDGAFLYLANVYDPSDGVGQVDGCFYGLDLSTVMDAMYETNDRTRALAQDMGFAALDMNGHFHGHGFYYDDAQNEYYDAADPSLWFYTDCIHPDDRGHHEIRRLVMAALQGIPLQLE